MPVCLILFMKMIVQKNTSEPQSEAEGRITWLIPETNSFLKRLLASDEAAGRDGVDT